MPYVTMPNISTGYLVSASDWNQLLANDQGDPAAIATTKGDVFAASAANTIARLGTGGDFYAPYWNSNSAAGLNSAPELVPIKFNSNKVTSGTGETDIVSTTLPGGYLSTNRVVIFRAFVDQQTSGANYSFRLYLGSTSVTVTYTAATANNYIIEGVIMANGATNAQVLHLRVMRSTTSTGSDDSFDARSAATEDTTTDKTIKFTMQASANSLTMMYGYFAMLPADGAAWNV